MSGGHAHGHGHGHAHGAHAPGAPAQPAEAGHGHSHTEHALQAGASRLAIALALTLLFFVVETTAGLWTHSLALISDAAHMLTDSGALILALWAQRIAARPRTRLHTFGFRRAEILAAMVNAGLLIATTVGIAFEGIKRLYDPPHIEAGPMLWVACGGLVVNLAAAVVLGTGGHDNSNMRAAFAHVVADALGSVASIVAALSLLYLDFPLADPLASLAIALLIGIGAVRLFKQTSAVLMETAPYGVDLHELERAIRETRGVADLHDLHAWSISDGFAAVTVHVVLDGSGHGTDVARAVVERVRKRFGIEHVTVQPEAPLGSLQIVPVERLTKRLSD
ncbi:MAG: cation diffusion facilitator family transporter [Myxococcaceae bacterium]|nr:cation diffusion facilitator family transporter [Myxococcaceae bacterium]